MSQQAIGGGSTKGHRLKKYIHSAEYHSNYIVRYVAIVAVIVLHHTSSSLK
jgi:hypothetical protein